MIKKILIANRGEIALRIIKTCRKLDIETIAIASKSELGHPHLKFADFIEVADKELPAEVYLDPNLIIATAKKFGADAIHPGYGFLAENSAFSQAVQNAGLIFIGPNPDTLITLGDKAQTRALAIELNVPVVPGYNGTQQEEKALLKQAIKIGFPLMLKAVMGGGGRGMRKVLDQSHFASELESAKKEAQRLYSNTDICIEKFVQEPRHIEIQVAGDSYGNFIHLFERDCSIQRRFQKVVEFSPANIEQEILNKLYKHAISVAKGSKLCGLATMEFLVSSKNNDIFFLEANPRIQVEHPVTEIICDQDLVELQIRIANGESIKLIKHEKKFFALQARIYAEAPEKNFIATSGKIRGLNFPNFENSFSLRQSSLNNLSQDNDCRLDHALYHGFELTQHFDPMLGKILVRANSYLELQQKALSVLNSIYILGIETNLPLLIALFKSELLYKLNIQDLENFKVDYKTKGIAAIACHLISNYQNNNSPYSQNWRNVNNKSCFSYYVTLYQEDKQSEISLTKSDTAELFLNDTKIEAKLSLAAKSANVYYYQLEVNGVNYSVITASPSNTNSYQLLLNGRLHLVEKIKEHQKTSDQQEGILISPLPGKVSKIHVKIGQKVSKGENLISIESMKIEHNIKSLSEENEIEAIYVTEGEGINFKQELLKFKQRMPES